MPPLAPTLVSFTRSGATGTAVVSGVDPANTCEVYGAQMLVLTGDPPVALLGSRVGAGAVALTGLVDVEYQGLTVPVPTPVWAVAKDPAGNYGPPSGTMLPRMFGTNGSLALSALTRSADRTELAVTVAGLGAETSLAIIGYLAGGAITLRAFTGNGRKTLTGLSAYGLPLSLVLLEYTADGRLNSGAGASEIGSVEIEAGSPLVEQIIDHVLQTLTSITTANGYHQDLRQAVRAKGDPLTGLQQFPGIEVWAGSEVKEDEDEAGRSNNELRLNLEVYHEDAVDPDEALSYLAADIHKALSVDLSRGGLALDTEVQSVERMFLDALGGPPTAGAAIEVAIQFGHKRGNPYQY